MTTPTTPTPQGKPPTPPQPQPQKRTATAFVFYDLDGYPCALALEGDSSSAALDVQQKMIGWLKQHGYKPAAAPALVPAPAAAAPAAEAVTPTCKYHGSAMKPGKGGKWFCPRKISGGGYCDYTVG